MSKKRKKRWSERDRGTHRTVEGKKRKAEMKNVKKIKCFGIVPGPEKSK